MTEQITARPELLKVSTFAEQLGITAWTARAWCQQGKVASVKIGKRVLIPASELGRLISQHTRPAVQQ